ncbi:P-loop containing nucleoside triphosphate hydrolase protein [Pavlovales sp. CCMP2436]|nr:P-loop containing nucleoside triphosphate hydrolase protein [Pavlovales sp. CCMP2436]
MASFMKRVLPTQVHFLALALCCGMGLAAVHPPRCSRAVARQQPRQQPRAVCRASSSAHDLSADETFATAAGGRLPASLAARAAVLGFERPTAVQSDALEVLLDGHDAIIHASTGSGKTLAYLLPLLAGLEPTRKVVQAVVIVPTRELGVQVAKLARQLAAGLGPISQRPSIMLLLDLSHAARERRWLLAEPPNVVIGNPDAVLRAISSGALRTAGVRMVVVDECDECVKDRSDSLPSLLSSSGGGSGTRVWTASAGTADAGSSASSAASVLSASLDSAAAVGGPSAISAGVSSEFGSSPLPSCDVRQTVFVSASVPQHRHFTKQCVGKRWMRPGAVHLHVAPAETIPSGISHRYVVCEPRERVKVLRQLLRAADRTELLDAALVFCRDDRPIEKLREALVPALGGQDGAVLELGADDGAGRRYRTMAAVRSREARVLVCALGLGAHRGIDLPHMSHVFLLDSTADQMEYLHAAGRCGRMGRAGTVITLVGEQELFALRRLANALQIEIEELEIKRPAQQALASP